MIPFFWRQKDRGEGRTSSGMGCTCCGDWEMRTTIYGLDLVSDGRHDDDMSTDRRNVMPGRTEGKENESRQEGRMGEWITRLLQQSNRDNYIESKASPARLMGVKQKAEKVPGPSSPMIRQTLYGCYESDWRCWSQLSPWLRKKAGERGERDRRYMAERGIVCLVFFSIAHRMPSQPINSIVVGMKHTHSCRVLATVVDDWLENLLALAPVQAYAYVQYYHNLW